MQSTAQTPATSKLSGQTVLLAAVVVGSCLLLGYLVLLRDPAASRAAAGTSQLTLADIPFDGQRAYDNLRELRALGPRPSGSAAMLQQQKLLAAYFKKLGANVRYQKFRVRHPVDGSAVAMANLIVEWHPERRERILLCTHYDTRPYPDQDARNPRGRFIGANDGASGTALLMQLGQEMPKLKGELGVDFVFFDGEEFVFRDGDAYFIGSEYFAQNYAAHPDSPRYHWAVLLDMVGDAELQIYPDRQTMSWEDSRPLVEAIWGTARRLGVVEFVVDKRCEVLDDHVKLHNLGGIPSCDILDFKYPAWHTQDDTPERCSALSLAKVGWVVHDWLRSAVKKP